MDIEINKINTDDIQFFHQDISMTTWKNLTLEVKAKKRRRHRHLRSTSTMYRDEDGDTLLHILIAKEDERVIECIQKSNAREINAANALGQTPIHLAVWMGNLLAVRAILSTRFVDLERYDFMLNSPIHVACGSSSINNPLIARELLSRIPNTKMLADLNERGLAPIHIAAQHQNNFLIDLLVKNGADIDIKDGKSGKTSLMLLVESRAFDAVHYVVEYLNANVDVKCYSDNSALHYACARNDSNVVRLLLEHGAEVGQKNVNKKTEKDLTTDAEIKRMIDSKWRKKRRERAVLY